MPELPFIPETITVHLGRPDENARNVTLPFLDYVANVASSEIYPTWPENAIRANIIAQMFASSQERRQKLWLQQMEIKTCVMCKLKRPV